MNIFQYIKEKQTVILLNISAIIIVSILLFLFDIKTSIIIVVDFTSLFFFLCSLGFDFYHIKSYYDNLVKTFQNLDEKTFITDIVSEPDFYSGQIFYNILKEAFKTMNDHIASYKKSRQDYENYIGLWVHEIKTPIAALKLILQNHRTNDITQMNIETNKIEVFVEQALYYARSSALNKDYRIEPVSLSFMVKEAVKAFSMNIIQVKGQVHMESLDINVTTDSKWVIFILKQLIDNSIKYRRKSLNINFYTERLKKRTVLCIKDSGIGIPASDIERIFDKGFTGSHGRQYTKSTGMGLYLCKILCKKLGLSIKAESEKSIGTTFKIYFPDKLKLFTDSH